MLNYLIFIRCCAQQILVYVLTYIMSRILTKDFFDFSATLVKCMLYLRFVSQSQDLKLQGPRLIG